MRVLIAVFSVIFAVHAYDAVYFSNQRDISSQSVEELVKSATAEQPVVFIVNPDFSLGQFSVKVNAYSSEPSSDFLAKSVKSSKYHGSQYLAHQISAQSAKVVTSADEFATGSAVYILAGEEWSSMESLAEQVISKLDSAVAILTSSDAVSNEEHNRVKRVATDEMTDSATGVTGGNAPNTYISMPLVLPPYNSSDFPGIMPTKDQTCLFYLEGLTVVVQQKSDKQNLFAAAPIPSSNLTWGYVDGDVSCVNGTMGSFLFRVRLMTTQDQAGKIGDKTKFTIPTQTPIDFTLNITGDAFGYWRLTGATMHSVNIVGTDQFKSASVSEKTVGELATQYAGINSVAGWSLTCSQTQAVFFPTSDDSVRIGVALMNTQVQLFQIGLGDKWVKQAHFTLQAEDCTGTFSPGSWMGIVSALVLVAGLIFGYLMLQSVQTMDRFDDPKQKQIVINVRE